MQRPLFKTKENRQSTSSNFSFSNITFKCEFFSMLGGSKDQ